MGHVIAQQTFHVGARDGVPRTITQGQALPDSDPAVKANPDLFLTPEAIAERDQAREFGPDAQRTEVIEIARAKPGEKRRTPPRPAAKPAGPMTTDSLKKG